jgi:hypothetical protein
MAEGDDNATTTTWLSGLDETLREDPSLTALGDADLVPMPKALAKSYVDTKRLVGRDKIPMPTTPEEYATVFERLGKPKTHDAYGLELPQDLPETAKPLMGENQQWFKEAVHKANLTDAQAKALWAEYTQKIMKTSTDVAEQYKQEMAAAELKLRAEHGTAYDAKIALANRALKELGGDELVELVAQTGLGRHPEGLKMMIKLGEIIAEEQGIDSSTGAPKGSAATLEQQLSETMADSAYMNAYDPRHKLVVQKALMLRRQLEDWNRRKAV